MRKKDAEEFLLMHEKKLVIIGNGFDLAHGLKTKWSDFEEYMSLNDAELYGILADCAKGDLWSDFETGLGKLELFNLYRGELDGFDMVENDEDEHQNHQKADQIRYIENLITDGLVRALNAWILSVDVCAGASQIMKKILKHATVISFNYTATLEKNYGFPTNHIIYLHGKASDVFLGQDEYGMDLVPDIVIGHGNSVVDTDILTYAKGLSDQIVLEEVITEGHRNVLEELKKNTNLYKNRLQDLEMYDYIYIIGHSLSCIDAPYFEKMRSCVKESSTIVVTYYPELECKEKKECRVRELFPVGKIFVKDVRLLIPESDSVSA